MFTQTKVDLLCHAVVSESHLEGIRKTDIVTHVEGLYVEGGLGNALLGNG